MQFRFLKSEQFRVYRHIQYEISSLDGFNSCGQLFNETTGNFQIDTTQFYVHDFAKSATDEVSPEKKLRSDYYFFDKMEQEEEMKYGNCCQFVAGINSTSPYFENI